MTEEIQQAPLAPEPTTTETTPVAASPDAAATASANEGVFQILKIYLKDSVFEIPNAPQIFKSTQQPELKISITNTSKGIEENISEVVLKGSITARIDNQVLFFIEVEQAGIFEIRNIPAEVEKRMLEVDCPAMLLPSLRFNIADTLVRAGFPPVNLSEINFGKLYEDSLPKN
ncbi:protein-export chaperone SecB [Polynucleobacter alcilacus]|uniref:protein-export chaperone SecB n=1 Tax=Polynucleobacter alcilacus TaxID=1819739 RepID=UPI001C0E3C47|nr:protein-export chaperone SecB [Polynucleobacter alcilacus]MBU3568580.1 protein-export chaperone SecB [Polynucleobacter alcilacus]